MSEFVAPYPVISREPSVHTSTAFSEIVTCRMPDGSVKKLLMKRGSTPAGSASEHHGGVPYEAEVYRQVLAPLAMSVPTLHATTSTPSETVLWMDYLDDAIRVSKVKSFLLRLRDAAAWIGEFHRRNEPRTAELAPMLLRYSPSYYVSWARRSLDLAAPLELAWLPAVCAAFEKMAEELADAVPTVIHGEFYPKNILVRASGKVVPVDWETAAIGLGEIDLASLIEGWSEDDAHSCQLAYQQARWQGTVPNGFKKRLLFAELYFNLRWLGDRSAWLKRQRTPVWQVRRLKNFAKDLGLLG